MYDNIYKIKIGSFVSWVEKYCFKMLGSASQYPNVTVQPSPSSGAGGIYSNVLATRHVHGEGGDACALPQVQYNNVDPFALGNVGIGNLEFQPDLCGHVFQIDCGLGTLNIIVTNSNLGGGLGLYSESAWPKATGNPVRGEARCSVQLSTQNSLYGGEFQCYYKPGTEATNAYYRNIGIFNTGRKIVTGATLGRQSGSHAGPNPYYAFTGRAIDANEEVIFLFNDGSTHSVKFSDCKSVESEQRWN
jgi:hypothetical protein